MNSLQPHLLHRQVPAIQRRQPDVHTAAVCNDCDANLQRRIAALLDCSARYFRGPDTPEPASPAVAPEVAQRPPQPACVPAAR
jgi:hypothetical protein